MPSKLLALLLCLSPALAQAKTKLSREQLRCIFQHPLEVGASITARVGEKIPAYATMENLLFGVKGAYYHGSPTLFFVSHYWQEDASDFRKAILHPALYDRQNSAIIATSTIDQTGAGQVEHLLSGDNKKNFQKSSAVLGIDLFYWDSIWNLCGYGMAKYSEIDKADGSGSQVRMDTEYQISRLIEASRKAGKTLFLGTVPEEDPGHIKINSKATGINGFWYPQNRQCVKSINSTLLSDCKAKNNCYLMRLDQLADTLNQNKTVHFAAGNEDLSLYDARPDGLHLGYDGSRFVAEQMINLFEEHPPTNCGSATPPATEPEVPSSAGPAQ